MTNWYQSSQSLTCDSSFHPSAPHPYHFSTPSPQTYDSYLAQPPPSPDPPPQAPLSLSMADPNRHQPPVPPPPGSIWFFDQFQYHNHSPLPPPPNHNQQQWAPPPPHAPYSAPPTYSGHNPYPPPQLPVPSPHPPHSQSPQYFPHHANQDWHNPSWVQNQGWEYPTHNNGEDWTTKARAWAATKTSTDDQYPQSLFTTVGRMEENQYPIVNPHHSDVQYMSLPASSYQLYPPSVAPPYWAPESASFNSGYVSDDHLPFTCRNETLIGDSNVAFHHGETSPSSLSVHQQEVSSSYSSVTGKEQTAAQIEAMGNQIAQLNQKVQSYSDEFAQKIIEAIDAFQQSEKEKAAGNEVSKSTAGTLTSSLNLTTKPPPIQLNQHPNFPTSQIILPSLTTINESTFKTPTLNLTGPVTTRVPSQTNPLGIWPHYPDLTNPMGTNIPISTSPLQQLSCDKSSEVLAMQHYSVPFSGGDPCEFIRGYEEFFKINPMTEIDRIQYVMQDFEGEVLEWYYQYVEENFLDTWTPDCWEDFVTELYGRFAGDLQDLNDHEDEDPIAPEVGDHKNLQAKIEDSSSTVTQVCAKSIHVKVIFVSHSDFSSPSLSTNTAVETIYANKKGFLVDKSSERNGYSVELKPKPPDDYNTAISISLKESKPVYIRISCNLPGIPHPTFSRELVPFSLSPKLSNQMGLEVAVAATTELLNKAVKPVMGGNPKLRVAKASDAFVKLAGACGYALVVRPSAKGLVIGHHPYFIGTYWGAVHTTFCVEIVESTDAYFFTGPIFSDYSSVRYSLLLREKVISLQSDRDLRVQPLVISQEELRVKEAEFQVIIIDYGLSLIDVGVKIDKLHTIANTSIGHVMVPFEGILVAAYTKELSTKYGAMESLVRSPYENGDSLTNLWSLDFSHPLPKCYFMIYHSKITANGEIYVHTLKSDNDYSFGLHGPCVVRLLIKPFPPYIDVHTFWQVYNFAAGLAQFHVYHPLCLEDKVGFKGMEYIVIIDPKIGVHSNYGESGFYETIDFATGKSILFVPRLPAEYAVWLGEIKPLSYYNERYMVNLVFYTDEVVTVLHNQYQGVGQPLLFLLHRLNIDSNNFLKTAQFVRIERSETDFNTLHPILTKCRVLESDLEFVVIPYTNDIIFEAHVMEMRKITVGMKEYQLESIILNHTYMYGGCRHCSYMCICATGENSSALHYGHAAAPNDRTFEEFLLNQRPEIISILPLLEYIHSKRGLLNVAAKLHYSLQNKVGPKNFISYGKYEEPGRGDLVNNLHFNMRDKVCLDYCGIGSDMAGQQNKYKGTFPQSAFQKMLHERNKARLALSIQTSILGDKDHFKQWGIVKKGGAGQTQSFIISNKSLKAAAFEESIT